MTSCKVNLIGRVEFGHVLVVAGKIAKDCNNFNVNLTSENEKEVGLTIFANVRTSQIVLNSFLNSSWRESIKFENVSALESDNAFKFYILAADDSLHIALNDKHLCKYPLQTKTVNIKSVNVSGELEKITQIDHRKIFPIPWPPVFDDLTSTAFSSDSPYQFTPGSVIVIKMKVTGSPKGSFFIRFNEKASKRQLFHFNPRFGEEIIVVNCQNDLLQ